MSHENKPPTKGISLRTVRTCLILLAVVLFILLVLLFLRISAVQALPVQAGDSGLDPAKLSAELKTALGPIRLLLMMLFLDALLMLWLSLRLCINPLLKAADSLQSGKPLPVTGTRELCLFAESFNAMLENSQSSAAPPAAAALDELTGLYNRAGFELLSPGADLKTTCMLLIDTDQFRTVNESYGRETGDRVLKRIAETIRQNFRSDDMVFRMGGDQFLVLMMHTGQHQNKLIRSKIRRINDTLAEKEDGLPAVSVSAGIAHGAGAASAEELLDQAGKALAQTKQTGRKGYTFFSVL